MTKYTADAHALPYPEGVDRVAVAADMQALAVKTGIAITAEGARVESALLPIVGALEATIAGPLLVNGSFRDGLTGWTNTGSWVTEGNGITSWARATSGADGALAQTITLPNYLAGRRLRLTAIGWTASAGSLFTRVITTAGNTDLTHTLTVGPGQTKTLDVTIPASQGTTPITVQVGRNSGNVYMTGIRLEAL